MVGPPFNFDEASNLNVHDGAFKPYCPKLAALDLQGPYGAFKDEKEFKSFLMRHYQISRTNSSEANPLELLAKAHLLLIGEAKLEDHQPINSLLINQIWQTNRLILAPHDSARSGQGQMAGAAAAIDPYIQPWETSSQLETHSYLDQVKLVHYGRRILELNYTELDGGQDLDFAYKRAIEICIRLDKIATRCQCRRKIQELNSILSHKNHFAPNQLKALLINILHEHWIASFYIHDHRLIKHKEASYIEKNQALLKSIKKEFGHWQQIIALSNSAYLAEAENESIKQHGRKEAVDWLYQQLDKLDTSYLVLIPFESIKLKIGQNDYILQEQTISEMKEFIDHEFNQMYQSFDYRRMAQIILILMEYEHSRTKQNLESNGL